MSDLSIGLLDQLKEPDRRSISSWAVGNVVMPDSKRAREWAIDTAYWLIEPLDAINDCEAVSVCKPTQTGGTVIYIVFLIWLVANNPVDCAMMGQTDTDAEYLLKAKILPALRSSTATASLMASLGRNDCTKSFIDLGTMQFRIHGPGKNSMQSASLEVLMLDECWLFPLGTIMEILERTSTREAARKIIAVSQAGEEKKDKNGKPCWDEWGGWWHRGTQEVYYVRCPNCATYFEPTTSCFHASPESRDRASKIWDWQSVRSSAFLETPCCKTPIQNTPTIRRNLSASGKYIATNTNPTQRHRSFRYSSWVVYWQDWGSLLEMYLRAQESLKHGNVEPLKIWTQKKEARWWMQSDQEIPSFKERKFFSYKLSDFRGGCSWDGSLLRLMAVDMQTDCFKVAIRDFQMGGKSRLIYQGTVRRWEDIAVIQTRFRIPPARVGVDAQNWTQEVYRQCAIRGWIALHGSSQRGWKHTGRGSNDITVRPFSPASRGRVAIATPGKNGKPGAPKSSACYYFQWSNLFFKDWLSRLINGAGVEWEYADDVDEEYLEALDSEARKTGGDGKPKWETIGKIRNHFWDVECMLLVMASVIGAMSPALAVFVETLATPSED